MNDDSGKLNLFVLLAAIDNKDYNFYDNLSAQHKKQFVPLLTSRWLTGTHDRLQIILNNAMVNKYVFTLHKHPALLYKLMVASNTGEAGRYTYPKTKKKDSVDQPVTVAVLQQYYGVSSKQAQEMIQYTHQGEVLEFAYQLAYDDTDIKKIKKEFK